MAAYLMTSSQKLFTATLIYLLGGGAFLIQELRDGGAALESVSAVGLTMMYILASIILYVVAWGANRLLRYVMDIWDDLETDQKALNK